MARRRGRRANGRRSNTSRVLILVLLLLGGAWAPPLAQAHIVDGTGGIVVPQSGSVPTQNAVCKPNLWFHGDKAVAPKCSPLTVRRAVRAANRIRKKPYIWGGGHGFGASSGFDCSGAVSYVLRGAKLLKVPRTSGALMVWRSPGPGAWLTIYANAGHAYMEVGGKRFDTSGGGSSGPRWRTEARSNAGFTKRHSKGL